MAALGRCVETLDEDFTLPLKAESNWQEWHSRDVVILRFYKSFPARQSETLALFMRN